MNELTEIQKIIPEHAKKIALAKMDLMKQWFEFRKKSNNKFKADYEFVQLYNTSNSNIFSILGKISRGTLHRWKAKLGDSEDYTKLLPHRHLYDRFSEIVKFETFSVADVKEIVDKLSEVEFSAEAIELLHKKYNRFRQIVQLINQLEIIAKENNLTEITDEIVRSVL